MIWLYLAVGAFVLLYLGKKLVSGDVAKVAQNAGFTGSDLLTAIAIAYAESKGNPNAVGDQDLAPDNGPSVGLWQINIGTRAHPEYANDDLTNPQINANRAFEVFTNAGNSFRPWSTFDPRNGTTPKYLAFLDKARSEVG